MIDRWSYSREFKVEAVRLVRDRGVSIAQVARDLDVHVNLPGRTSSAWQTAR